MRKVERDVESGDEGEGERGSLRLLDEDVLCVREIGEKKKKRENHQLLQLL